MRRIIKINENDLKNIINESVKRCLNELSYDDWKLMTPEEGAGLSEEDYKITIEVATNANKMNDWNDCDVFDVQTDEDGGVVFKVTFNDGIWVGRYDNDSDIKEHIGECVYSFVEAHGGADGGYDLIDWEII